MPIQDLTLPEPIPADNPSDSATIHYLINNINGLKAARPRPRILAFALDFALLHGFSMALAQWLAVLMLRSLLKAKVTKGGIVIGASFFQYAYQYGVTLIWPVALLFTAFIYFVSCTHLWGATLGQGLFGLRVVTRTGELPSLEKAGRRFFASVFTFFSMGFFFFLGAYNRDGLCFHDEASGTRVVRRDSWKQGLWYSEASPNKVTASSPVIHHKIA